MRRAIYILFAVISISLLLSGCAAKSYWFDFTDEPDLARNDGVWTTQSTNYELIPSTGLILKGIWAAAPHFYNGDFKVEYVFEIKTDDTYYRIIYSLLSSDVDINEADWWGGLCITDFMYNIGDFHLSYVQKGSFYPIATQLPVSQILVYPGQNSVTIEKTGDLFSIELNGVELETGLEVSGYSLDWFCPVIISGYEPMAPWDLIVFKSLEVLYKGEQAPTY